MREIVGIFNDCKTNGEKSNNKIGERKLRHVVDIVLVTVVFNITVLHLVNDYLFGRVSERYYKHGDITVLGEYLRELILIKASEETSTYSLFARGEDHSLGTKTDVYSKIDVGICGGHQHGICGRAFALLWAFPIFQICGKAESVKNSLVL